MILSPGYTQEEKIQYTPELIKKMEDLQAGNLNSRQKAKLADDLYRAGAKDEAISLFEENLPKDYSDPDIPHEAYLNYGTALLEKGRIQEGLSVYDNLSEKVAGTPEAKSLKETIEKNTVAVFKQQKEKKKKEQEKKDQENKENKDNKDSKDQNQQGQSGQGQSQDKQQQGKPGDDKNKDPQKDGKDKQDKKDKGDQGEEKKDDEGKGEEDKKDKPDDDDQKVGENKNLPPKKLAPKLKQLMSDDRQLQMKMTEQGTRELNRKKLRNSKDW